MTDHIPYKEAIALKALSFDETCSHSYRNSDGEEQVIPTGPCKNSDIFLKDNADSCAAPSYKQAFKFFRDKHMLKGDVHHADSNGTDKFTIWGWNFDNNVGKWERLGYIGAYQHREEAELACLKELIKLVQLKPIVKELTKEITS